MKIIEQIYRHYNVNKNAEITLEANPDNINSTYLRSLKSSAVNRLSIGVQSFYDEDLNYLSRIHNANQSERAIKSAQDFGFENLSIDLIYGTPTLSDKKWEEEIQQVIKLNIPHLSAYSLTIEPKTILNNEIIKKKKTVVNEAQSAEQFLMLMNLTNEFFHQYEISNFCKEGYISKHNSAYWKGEKYLGIGPSAHSYNHESRQWNVSNLSTYIQKISSGETPYESEFLSIKQKYNEYVMTAIRTIWGVNLKKLELDFGKKYSNYFNVQSNKHIKAGNIENRDPVFVLSKRGKLFADSITADLFYNED